MRCLRRTADVQDLPRKTGRTWGEATAVRPWRPCPSGFRQVLDAKFEVRALTKSWEHQTLKERRLWWTNDATLCSFFKELLPAGEICSNMSSPNNRRTHFLGWVLKVWHAVDVAIRDSTASQWMPGMRQELRCCWFGGWSAWGLNCYSMVQL